MYSIFRQGWDVEANQNRQPPDLVKVPKPPPARAVVLKHGLLLRWFPMVSSSFSLKLQLDMDGHKFAPFSSIFEINDSKIQPGQFYSTLANLPEVCPAFGWTAKNNGLAPGKRCEEEGNKTGFHQLVGCLSTTNLIVPHVNDCQWLSTGM